MWKIRLRRSVWVVEWSWVVERSWVDEWSCVIVVNGLRKRQEWNYLSFFNTKERGWELAQTPMLVPEAIHLLWATVSHSSGTQFTLFGVYSSFERLFWGQFSLPQRRGEASLSYCHVFAYIRSGSPEGLMPREACWRIGGRPLSIPNLLPSLQGVAYLPGLNKASAFDPVTFVQNTITRPFYWRPSRISNKNGDLAAESWESSAFTNFGVRGFEKPKQKGWIIALVWVEVRCQQIILPPLYNT